MRTTLTAFVPAHKQTNPEHAPGQQINPVNPLGFVDKTLGDYIRRKDGIDKAFEAVAKEQKECCGNPLRGCENCPPRNKQDDIAWCKEAFAMTNSTPWKMKLEVVIRPDGSGHIQCYGCELVLLPDGTWFMNDTSGG